MPPPDFGSNVNATENSTINVTGFSGALAGNLSVDAGKTLTVAGNRLTVDDVSAGAGGTVLFNSPQGNAVSGSLGGEGTSVFCLVRDADVWHLEAKVVADPACDVVLDGDVAWRLWTKGLISDDAPSRIAIHGEASLAAPMLAMTCVMA